jgi:hypothetical protein
MPEIAEFISNAPLHTGARVFRVKPHPDFGEYIEDFFPDFGWNPNMAAIVRDLCDPSGSLQVFSYRSPAAAWGDIDDRHELLFVGQDEQVEICASGIKSHDWMWSKSMFLFEEDLGILLPEAVEEPQPEPAPEPPTHRNAAPDYDLLKDQLAKAWQRMVDVTSDFPELQSKAAKRITDSATTKELPPIGLGADLRVRFEVKIGNGEFLQNDYARRLITYHLNKWLTAGGYDPTQADWVNNQIPDPAQPKVMRKLTRVLAALMPDPIPNDALSYMREFAGVRELPTREGFIGLLGQNLRQGKTVTISANPADFVTASFGGGFSSCHGPKGVHFSGNVGLARMNNVFMAYTGTPEKKDGRMWIYYDPSSGQIWQLKSYGSFPQAMRMPVREFLESRIAPDATWVLAKDSSPDVRRVGGSSSGYLDYQGGNLVYQKHLGKGLFTIEMQHPICVTCGCESDMDDESLRQTCQCEGCDTKHRCSHCGDRVDEDDVRYAGDDVYCYECWSERYTYCENCDEATNRDDITTVYDRWGSERYICDHCRENGDYFECEECGAWHHTDRLRVIENQNYCESCADIMCYAVCESCGEAYFEENFVHQVDMCRDCTEEKYWYCEECEGWYEKGDTCECEQEEESFEAEASDIVAA